MLRRSMLLTVTLLLAALSFGTPARAADAEAPAAEATTADEATLDILRDTIRANKKALVAANLKLTDEEAGKFWPLYDRYHAELKPVEDRFVKVIEDYIKAFTTLSDEQAMALLEEYLSVEENRVKVRRSYVAEFAKVLPGKKVGRFYQIENKMDAVVRYDLAATVPVVEE